MKHLLTYLSLVITTIFFSFSQSIVGPIGVCEEEISNYSANIPNGAFYTWNSTSTTSNITNGNTYDVVWGQYASGQITLIVEDSTRSVIYTGALTVTINPKPRSIIQASSINECVLYGEDNTANCWVACEGVPITYSVPSVAGNTYQWSVLGATSIQNPTTNEVTVTWSSLGIGEIKLVQTNSFGCSDSVKQCILAISKPTANFTSVPSIANNSVKLCKGSTLYLSDNSGNAIRWDWDFGDGFRSSQRNTDHTFNIPGVYNLTLNVYNECGCIDSKTIIVDVTPTVGPEIICPSVVCEGDTAIYHTTSICPAYKWEVTNGTIVGTDSDIEVKVIWEEHTGFLELNTFNCPGTCPEKTAIKIPVISDSLEIKGSLNTCFNEFETYFIDQIPESDYTWTVDPSIGSIYDQDKNKVIVAITGNSGIVAVSIDHPIFGCMATDSIIVTSRPKLEITTTENAFCQGDSFAFQSNFAGIWKIYDANTTVNFTSSASTTYDVNSSTIPPGSYFVEIAGNGYCNPYAHYPIEVLPKPSKPASIDGELLVCPQKGYEYSVPQIANATAIWEIPNGSPFDNIGNKTTVNWLPTGPYKITTKYENNTTGCTSDTTELTVHPFISAPPQILGDAIACGGVTKTYKVNITSDVYDWTLVPASAGSIISDRYADSIIVIFNNNAQNSTAQIKLEGYACNTNLQLNKTVQVLATPSADFTYTGGGCAGDPIQFNCSLGTAWSWDFGDGNTSSAQNPTHTFNNGGSYVVSLTITNPGNNGCSPLIKTTKQITVNSKAKAKISSPDQLLFCIPVIPAPATFYASVQGNSASYSYTWYDNGNTVGTGTTYTTSSPGSYYFIATPATGCSLQSTSLDYIVKNCGSPCDTNSHSVNFAVSKPSGCQSAQVQTFTTNLQYLNYTINWGSSGVQGNNGPFSESFVYSNAGKYKVSLNFLYVTPNNDTCGFSASDTVTIYNTANFDYEFVECAVNGINVKFNNTTTYVGNQPSALWNIDGVNYSTYDVTKVMQGGTYQVTLTTTSNGCTTSVTKTIDIPTPGKVDFTHTAPACQQEPVIFNSTVLSGNIINYQWDLNSKTLNNPNVTATFENSNNYGQQLDPFIFLYTQDDTGCRDTVAKQITIDGNELYGSSFNPPTVTSNSPNGICYGDSALISINPIITTSNTPINYIWSNLATNDTTWGTKTGDYGVRISDAANCRLELPPVNLSVQNGVRPAIEGKTTYCALEPVSLSFYYNYNIDYKWYIDGVVVQQNFIDQLDTTLAPGTYEIKVTTENLLSGLGCKDSTTLSITVLPPPAAPTITSTAQLPYCEGQSIVFTAFSPDALNYNWNSGQSSPSITVNQPYNYKVTITDAFGCTNSDSTAIHPLPDFSHFLTGCYCFPTDDNAPVVHGPSNASTYQWYLNGGAVAAPVGVADSFRTVPGEIQLTATTSEGCTANSGILDISAFPCTNCTVSLANLNIQCAGRDANGALMFSFGTDFTFSGTQGSSYFVTSTINGTPAGSISQLNLLGTANGTKPLTGLFTIPSANETDILCIEVTVVDPVYGICRFEICEKLPEAQCEIVADFSYVIDPITCVATFTNTSIIDPCTFVNPNDVNWTVNYNNLTALYTGNSFSIGNLSGAVEVCMSILGVNYMQTNDCHPDVCKEIEYDWEACNKECEECQIEVNTINFKAYTTGCEFQIDLDLDNFGGDLTYIGGNSVHGLVTSFSSTSVPIGNGAYSFTFISNNPSDTYICVKLFFEHEGEICCIEVCLEIPPCDKGRKKGTIEVEQAKSSLPNDFLIVPNPASNFFTLKWQPFANANVINASIYDMHFQLVKTVTLSNEASEYRFESEGFRSGVYLVVLETSTNRISKPLIITKP